MDLEDVYTGDQLQAVANHVSVKDPSVQIWTQGKIYVVGQLTHELTSDAVASIGAAPRI